MLQPPASRTVDLLRLSKRHLGGLAYRSSEACLQAVGVPPPSALLILGHMRSGSSLLLHLLLTNPGILSLGERNAPYATRGDLVRLAAVTRLRMRRVFAPVRYVADQVNHNRFTPTLHVLRHPRVRTIFLLRRPQASLGSLMELSRVYYGQSWTLARAVDYYVTRLQFLQEVGNGLRDGGKAAFVTYEQLTGSTAPTLALLQEFLDLQTGFSSEYRSQPFTGKRGDPGPKIGQGKIVATDEHASFRLPAEDWERATQAYLRCREDLAKLTL